MKKIIAIILVILIFILAALPVLAEEHSPRLVDNADLLDNNEEFYLLSKLDEISERQQFDVVIVTADGIGEKSPMQYADDFYDYNEYGFGENNDGALLLIDMDENDWYISATGYGITALTDYGIDLMSEEFLPYLSDGDFYKAFDTYARLCDDYVTQAKTGKPYDVGNAPKKPLSLIWIPGAIIIGMFLAFIICEAMKSKLKSVRFKAGAGSYVRSNSMRVTQSSDIYLYRNITRVARPKNNNSGGSSTHMSSSGTMHSGRGGKF